MNPANSRPKPSVRKLFTVGVASLVKQGNVLPLSLAVLGVALLPSEVVCEVAFRCPGAPGVALVCRLSVRYVLAQANNGAKTGPSGN
jgi:hypothetical protein